MKGGSCGTGQKSTQPNLSLGGKTTGQQNSNLLSPYKSCRPPRGCGIRFVNLPRRGHTKISQGICRSPLARQTRTTQWKERQNFPNSSSVRPTPTPLRAAQRWQTAPALEAFLSQLEPHARMKFLWMIHKINGWQFFVFWDISPTQFKTRPNVVFLWSSWETRSRGSNSKGHLVPRSYQPATTQCQFWASLVTLTVNSRFRGLNSTRYLVLSDTSYPIVSPFFVLYWIQVVSFRILICLQSQVCHLTVFFFLYVFHYIRYIQGYKECEIIFRTGGLGRHMQEDVHESWVCMDHYWGDSVFCCVYNEIDQVFTPWGTNSELA